MLKNNLDAAKEQGAGNLTILSVVKGLVAAYIISIPAFLLFALILVNTDFPDKFKTIAVIITTIISILAAGMTATRGLKNRGWLNGSIVGLIYMLVLYILSSIVYNNFSVDRYVITMTIIGVLTGAIGGITGINLKTGAASRSRRVRE
jgi:putative membrane protein (TIGR04086 family)